MKSSEFENIGAAKIKSLGESIKEINELVEERFKLSKEIVNEAESIKLEIKNFLTNQPFDSDGYKERIALKQKQIEISELQLNESVNCWRDVSDLKRELRGYKKELNEKENKAEILNNILK